MKLSEQEKAAHRAAFQAMTPAKKAEHIFTYYKWPILLSLLALIILGSALQRQLTKKEPVLYLAVINVAVGEALEQQLTSGFLSAEGFDARRQEVTLYRDLYLSENADTVNHEYAYASKMKLSGAIGTKALDLALMNRESYDLLSRQGYLLDLDALLRSEDPALLEASLALLVTNEVILSDNSIDWQLGEAEAHEVVTEPMCNGLESNGLPLFEQAGFSDRVYLGIIANSPRTAEAVRYLHYLLQEP